MELKLTSQEAYTHLQKILEQVSQSSAEAATNKRSAITKRHFVCERGVMFFFGGLILNKMCTLGNVYILIFLYHLHIISIGVSKIVVK